MEKEKLENIKTNKVLIYVLAFFCAILVAVSAFFAYDFYLRNSLDKLNNILSKDSKTITDCKIIYDFDKESSKKNKYFPKEAFEEAKIFCKNSYSLNESLFQNENEYCRELIANTNSYFRKNFLFVNEKDLIESRDDCEKKYLKSKIIIASNASVFNGFKTNIEFDFNSEIARGLEHLDEAEKKEIKVRILNKIRINPKVNFSMDDLFLGKSSANLVLPLKGKTDYLVNFQRGDSFAFKVPEIKYFGVVSKNPVSLYSDKNLPVFQLLSYNSGKNKAKINICKLNPREYGKIEVFSETKDIKSKISFLKEKLKKENYKYCYAKEISIEDGKDELNKKDFNLDEFLKGKNGLYTVFLDFSENIDSNKKVNNPVFFAVINSHIMMKVSKKGEAFFFVTDLEGKPLANQEIGVYLNDFEEFDKNSNWNSQTRRYESRIDYKFSEGKEVFSEKIILGKTGNDGILKVNAKEKIKNIFSKTFGDAYKFDYRGLYDSFFVEAIGEKNRGYLTSTWNAGIEPWNFGYSYRNWSRNNSEYKNEFSVADYHYKNEFNAHIFTDRVLYLPGEKVYIKGVIRESENLGVPKSDTKFQFLVKGPKGKEILSKNISANEFGSFSEELDLGEKAKLGAYYISLKTEKGNYVADSGFSVEVFKKPKFKNEVSLEVEGLNGEFVDIKKEEKLDSWRKNYLGDFKIKGFVKSTYYNGGVLKNTDFSYKVYKQAYYGEGYWDDCYYGCYWTPEKIFYTEGKGKIGESGIGKFEIPVKFKSSYDDYKYIVEITVKDKASDIVTGSNSVIVKLPDSYKAYNYRSNFSLKPSSRFVKVGEKLKITGGLNIGKWSDSYNNRFLLVIKRKNYANKKVTDINGYSRNIVDFDEKIEKVLLVNNKDFRQNKDGKLEYDFEARQNGEYIFEYGDINTYMISLYFSKDRTDVSLEDIKNMIDTLRKNNFGELSFIENRKSCEEWSRKLKKCVAYEFEKYPRKVSLKNLMYGNYFPVIAYGGKNSENPIENDNKLNVISEKVSYKVGETAKILVRLPVSKSKILLTIEKSGVKKSEYIDVEGNTFFKEIKVDDSFAPNAYVSVFMVDLENKIIPEYKVGYTEIVLDKTDKKSFIKIKSDKEEYAPRGEVGLHFEVKDKAGKAVKSELTVMVVDDSLISLMGNINPNILEKIFIKLPFSVQTSMSNIAMIRNYYFSRRGLVGGSGFGNFKGGDSAVSTRNIFKNTAFYKADLITDENGKAKVKFTLPDNLTNFRVMVVSNSKDNHFGYSEKFIKVRKPVILEDKTPLILRVGDKAQIGSILFNNTGKDMGFKTKLEINGVKVENKEKNITLKAGASKFLTWNIEINNPELEKITYTISALGDSAKNSDKLENTIEIKKSPVLLNQVFRNLNISEKKSQNENIIIPENTDYKNSKVKISVSNNRIMGIEKIAKSLAKYPYGCIEQLTSSTLPNVLLKNLLDFFPDVYSEKELNKNITAGLEKILSQQNEDGGFSYWARDNESSLHATPYVLRTLIYMKNRGENISDEVINKAVSYLEKNYKNANNDEKAEIYFALKMASKNPEFDVDIYKLSRHSLISYTYGLVLSDNQNRELIEKYIEIIKYELEKKKDNYYYWNELGDKAIFTKLLLDYDYKKYSKLVDKYIEELYQKNWSSYYFSTQTKNNTFMAFYKYLNIRKNFSASYVFVKAGKKEIKVNIGKNKFIEKFELPLLDLVSENSKNLEFKIENNNNHNVYVDLELDSYPLNIEKVKAYSSGVKLQEKIYEVLDEKNLGKCSSEYYGEKIDCSKVLKEIPGKIFEKGKLYKSEIIVNFPENKRRNNVTIEDYLPGTFRVINSKFKTESSSIREAGKSWRWNYTEFRPNVVMANAGYFYDSSEKFEFYFRPEFSGTFTNPPATVYEMYNPKVRAYNEYKVVEVR